jgi:predicted glycogen debranching enzyme
MSTAAEESLCALDGAALEPARALDAEWLETDGLGGFACGTAHGTPTRRYHGLLVTPIEGTAERHLFLARMETRLVGPQGAVPLVAPRLADGPPAEDLPRPTTFALVPWPRSTHQVGECLLVSEVLADRGAGGVLLRYTLHAAGPRVLELTPRFACRRADALTVANEALRTSVVRFERCLSFQPYDSLPPVTLRTSRAAAWTDDPHWQRGIEYAKDRERGYDHHEDAFAPGHWRVELQPGESLVIAARVGDTAPDPEPRWEARAADRSAALGARPLNFQRRLALAADDFLQRTPSGRLGVIAGFPWFLEWGRDTFLSLPGLTLARGRSSECWEALGGALPFLRQGLLPNIFGTGQEDSHYGSADAALWFARAVRLLGQTCGDTSVLRSTFAPALTGMAEAYAEGAPLGLRFDPQWTLHAGSPELNPTWMDANLPEGPVTPRHGAPVEIAALGHLLLCTLVDLGGGEAWAKRRDLAAKSFRERFWLSSESRLADLWRDGQVDRRLRPNMLFAAAMDCAPLSVEERRGVVDAAAPLLTPVGLRTLGPDDDDYVPHYGGGTRERDRAYHQGTVWPWLLGAWVEASLRAGRTSPSERAVLRARITTLEGQLDRGGLGHISEVFSAEPPHAAGGTFAQAWNTAELLRALDLIDGNLTP